MPPLPFKGTTTQGPTSIGEPPFRGHQRRRRYQERGHRHQQPRQRQEQLRRPGAVEGSVRNGLDHKT